MSNGSVFSGRLEEFRLVELLQMMGLGSNTGALHLHQDNGRTGLLYFDNGALVSSTELDTEALTLGHVLQQLNLAGATQLEHAFQLQTQDPLGKRIGERLIDLGILTVEQLTLALKTQTLWTARELALWRSGSYEFHPGEHVSATGEAHRIDSTRAVMEVLRYEHEWDSLQLFLPQGMRTRISMAYEPPHGHPLLFHAAAWRVISRVNAHRTVRRIATSLHQPEVEVARMIGPLIKEGLLVPIGSESMPGLPEEAARLSMNNFDLFSLLIEMEQDWLKRKTLLDHLVALANFVNRTMKALEDECRENGLSLAPDTLYSILSREGLLGTDTYRFRISQNRIEVDHFAAFCRDALENSARNAMGTAKSFYEEFASLLQQALVAAFESINSRVASPIERAQNQEAWEALFLTLHGEQADTA